ncbi:DEAD/DEAH box helicase [Sinimarinibacterium flocculans]|uniref:Helicase-like protein n=1 Tax=Sinimarinibacterium flocculans TaxID=985250 RepID=A0A318E0T9_9GAMM|nr:DEAD/DEAH box helicase [Sinimarinibacterium flocculans]PXV64304.1 helicase-like protein [Sinimarinibacterium flocculans]
MPSIPRSRRARSPRARKSLEPRYSRTHRPDEVPIEHWQAALRRQFGREQSFEWENLGSEPVFSEFVVCNPDSGGRYRVAIRGAGLGDNYCACPDFATNELGTCKHVEFLLAKLAARRGGKTAFKNGYAPTYSELYLHYGAQRNLRLRPGSDCPPALAQQARRLFDPDADWRLRDSGLSHLEDFIAAAGKAGHDLRCYEDALNYVAQLRDAGTRAQRLAEVYPKGAASSALKKLLKVPLFPYQAEGALFAVRAGRALIGDEMGLGKTVQAIAVAEIYARHFGVERVLVVCPTSLKHQWQRELQRFAGREAQVIQGGQGLRRQQYREPAFCKIVNYDVLARDLDDIRGWAPDLVIADEAQRIKNWNTVAARALKRIDSPHALVLTGTPLENRLEELVSIVQFVDRHRLGPTWKLLHDHQQRDEGGRVTGYVGLDRLGRTLAPILIRRRKADVLDELPQRLDKHFFVPMTPQQQAVHEENRETVARIIQRWRRMKFLADADQRALTCALQNMRMACNSTFLLDGQTDHGCKVDELLTLLEELFEQPDAKVVIFSQWLRTHELIRRRLEQRGWGHVLFHGGVPGAQRGALVSRFHDDPDCRVFLSTDAGGIGLNLQHAASTVVNMDLPWNPAVLEQRIGRVHRLGQTRGVRVVNFIAEGTIEEGMLSLLAFKKSLFAGVLDGGSAEVFLHGTRLSKFMETVEAATGATTGEMRTAAPAESGMSAAPEPQPAESTPQVVPGDTSEKVVDNPWADLLDAGLKLVTTLAEVQNGSAESAVETDPRSGQSYLRLPMPPPETLHKLAVSLSELVKALQPPRAP